MNNKKKYKLYIKRLDNKIWIRTYKDEKTNLMISMGDIGEELTYELVNE